MSDPHEVISAFLDDEPFEADRLAEALSEPDGRALLLDLVALRHMMQPPESASFEPRRTPSPLRALIAAAAVVIALVSGYVVGQQRSENARSEAPPATRIIESTTDWQPLP